MRRAEEKEQGKEMGSWGREWGGGWQRSKFIGFTELMDHWVRIPSNRMSYSWSSDYCRRWIACSSLRITTYSLHTTQRVYPSNLRLVTSLSLSTFLPTYCNICYSWCARAWTCRIQAWGWTHSFSSTYICLGCVGLSKASRKVMWCCMLHFQLDEKALKKKYL